MSQTRTKLKIDGWERKNQKIADNYSARFGEKTFSVIGTYVQIAAKLI
jgi:hypothetical protein